MPNYIAKYNFPQRFDNEVTNITPSLYFSAQDEADAIQKAEKQLEKFQKGYHSTAGDKITLEELAEYRPIILNGRKGRPVSFFPDSLEKVFNEAEAKKA